MPYPPEATSMLDPRTIFYLFNRSILVAVPVLIVAKFGGINLSSSVIPVLPPALTILSAVALGRWRLGFQYELFRRAECVASFFVLALSITSVDLLASVPELWSGFGTQVLVFAAVGLLIAVNGRKVFNKYANDKVRFRLWFTLCTIVLLMYLPVFIQPSYGLLNLGDTTYHVLDEMLAPVVGRFPYFDYSPQYTAIYGWLLSPLRWIPFSTEQEMNIIILVCNLLTVLVPLAVVGIVKNTINGVKAIFPLTAITVVLCVSGSMNGASSQLKEFSFFGRYLPVLLVILLLSHRSFSNLHHIGWRSVMFLGVLLGINLINNPEFGLLTIFALAAAFVVPICRDFSIGILFSGVITSASVLVIAYMFGGTIFAGSFDLQSVIGIRLGGSSLYPEASTKVFGVHLMSIGICMTGIARGLQIQLSGWSLGRSQQIAMLEILSSLFLAGVLYKFFLWPIGPGALQLLLPSLLVVVFLIADATEVNGSLGKLIDTPLSVAGPIFLVLALSVGALVQIPNPLDEFRRVTGNHAGSTNWSSTPGRVADGWSVKSLNEDYSSLIDVVSRVSGQLDQTRRSVAFFGMHGNAVELATGVRNVVGIAAPESMRFGGNQPYLACKPLSVVRPQYVIVYGTDFPCEGYSRMVLPIGDDFLVFQKIDLPQID